MTRPETVSPKRPAPVRRRCQARHAGAVRDPARVVVRQRRRRRSARPRRRRRRHPVRPGRGHRVRGSPATWPVSVRRRNRERCIRSGSRAHALRGERSPVTPTRCEAPTLIRPSSSPCRLRLLVLLRSRGTARALASCRRRPRFAPCAPSKPRPGRSRALPGEPGTWPTEGIDTAACGGSGAPPRTPFVSVPFRPFLVAPSWWSCPAARLPVPSASSLSAPPGAVDHRGPGTVPWMHTEGRLDMRRQGGVDGVGCDAATAASRGRAGPCRQTPIRVGGVAGRLA